MESPAAWIAPAVSFSGLVFSIITWSISTRFSSYKLKLEDSQVSNESYSWLRPVEILHHVSVKSQALLVVASLVFFVVSLLLWANLSDNTNESPSTKDQKTEKMTDRSKKKTKSETINIYNVKNKTFGERFKYAIKYMGGGDVVNIIFSLAFGFVMLSVGSQLVAVELAAKSWCDRYLHMADGS